MRTKLTVACALTALAAVTGGTAQAAGLIHTSGIAKGAVTFNRLAPSVQNMVAAKAHQPKNGKQGVKGSDGATGAQGATGDMGPQGAAGIKGDTGAKGADGAKGLAGTNGANGAKGDTGLAGPIGPMGPKGFDGVNGAKGDTGAKGNTGWQGPQGTTGMKGADGAKGPAGANGTNGGNGAKGDAGPKGDAGKDGTNGIDGTNGKDGTNGIDGTNGKDGTNGMNGVDGLNPAVAVTAGNMQGFVLDGATLAGGELRLAGGFDGSTIAGADGATKTYPFGLLSKLDALSVSQHRDVRTLDGNGNPSADSVTIHVSLLNANRVSGGCGFTNLVFNGYYNGDHQQDFNLDAVHGGKLWSTHALVGVSASQASPSTLAEIQANDTCAGGAQVVAISVDNGDTSGTGTTPAANFSAGADALVVGFDGSFTRYDFGG